MTHAGGATRQHHLFIAGTGRAGTSFLVRYLAELGLQTHLGVHDKPYWHEDANAGLEDLPIPGQEANLPYVVKTPWMSEILDVVLNNSIIEVDAVIIPVRDLTESATSRIVLELQAIHQAQPWMVASDHTPRTWGLTPGGIVFSLNPIDQARLLAEGFFRLVERLVRADIPIHLLSFPRFVEDGHYLFDKLRPLLPATLTPEQAVAAHANVADVAKVRIGEELRKPSEGLSAPCVQAEGSYPDLVSLDLIAARREVGRLNDNLVEVRADLLTATTRAEELRKRCDVLQAERNVAIGLLTSAQAAEDELTQSLARAQADLKIVRDSTSWRITAPLRGLGRLIRKPAG